MFEVFPFLTQSVLVNYDVGRTDGRIAFAESSSEASHFLFSQSNTGRTVALFISIETFSAYAYTVYILHVYNC